MSNLMCLHHVTVSECTDSDIGIGIDDGSSLHIHTRSTQYSST